jgi:RNA polymerase sigma-70 factor (ECF subfamily)
MTELSDNFESIYKAYYNMLCNAAENIIGDADASQDIVQEVFIKLWNKKEDIHKILNPKAYLFKSVINTSITYLEKNKNKIRLGDLKVASQISSDSRVLAKELESKINEALHALPTKCKAIFVLSRFEGMKNKEIAEHLGVSIKTVENQMGIAFKKLRNDLNPFLTKEFLSLLLLVGISAIIRVIMNASKL